MMLSNRDIAQIFCNIADMLEIQGENKFKFLSYRRAGETLAELPRSLQAYVDDGTLEDIPGVGKAIGEKIRELLATGKLDFYEQLRAQVPETLLDIMRVNGVGAKKAKLFWEQLGITTLAELEAAARDGKLRALAGMGEKSEQKLLTAIAALAQHGDTRMPIGKAKPIVERILAHLLTLEGVQEGALAGSLRRGRATIGDGDILIASDAPAPIMHAFVTMDGVARVLAHGDTKSSIEHVSGLQVDLRVLPKAHWGTALQYFTGSKAHNVKLRQLALERGYSLNESALSPVGADKAMLPDAPKHTFDSEEALYHFLGLAWIPPELREDEGEIEQARAHTLPKLITRADIQGDLHMHTTWSDGKLSLREMVAEAHQRGYRYIVITDHSQSATIANGLSVERLLAQQAQVRQLNAAYGDSFHVLHGAEVDIKADGTLDYPDEVLAQLDFVVASLHVALTQSRAQITQRLLNALQNPHVDLIGHPSARYINERPPVDADWDAVFAMAQRTGTALEINSNPRRLDLDAPYARRAAALGIPLAINTDAHDAHMLDLMDYGVITARRGWVTAEHVINARSFERFMAWLAARQPAV